MAARKGKTGAGKTGNEAQAFVRLIRLLTEEQFDFWITALNRAASAMQADVEPFTRDDRQRTVSYWYLLMLLLEIYAAGHDPFAVKKGETWVSDGLTSMQALSGELADRYKEETVRRYVFDLKRCGLIVLAGRGPDAQLHLTAPAILALADTMRQWVSAFRDVDLRVKRMGAM